MDSFDIYVCVSVRAILCCTLLYCYHSNLIPSVVEPNEFIFCNSSIFSNWRVLSVVLDYDYITVAVTDYTDGSNSLHNAVSVETLVKSVSSKQPEENKVANSA